MVKFADHLIDPIIQENPQHLWSAKGQLTQHDRLLYHYLGKTYRGLGSIIDAGALVGGTTKLIASGIKSSALIDDTKGRIHVYDLFEDSSNGPMASVIRKWFDLPELESGERFNWLPLFESETAEYADMIAIHPGNILEKSYSGEDIEILSVDVGKTPQLMLGVAKIFFPHLIPGKSLVVHQDYIFTLQPWLAIFMELLDGYFEKIYENQHCSAIFLAKKRITEDQITDICGEVAEDYYHIGNVEMLYHAIDHCTSRVAKAMLSCALAFFYSQMGQPETGRYVFRRAVVEYNITRHLMERTVIAGFARHYLGLDLSEFD